MYTTGLSQNTQRKSWPNRGGKEKAEVKRRSVSLQEYDLAM